MVNNINISIGIYRLAKFEISTRDQIKPAIMIIQNISN